MARAFCTDVLMDTSGNVVANALGTIYTDEAGTVLASDAYAAASGGSPITTLTTDTAGRWSVYFTTPKSFWIRWSDNGQTAFYPAGAASSSDNTTLSSALASALTTFAAKADDDLVVHLAGTETVTGAKTFNAGSLIDKGNVVYNVKAYGAVGDGTTDDTAAIQATIDACIGPGDPTVVGRSALGVVYLPTGTYKVTSRLYFRGVRGLRIVGAGMYLTFISASGTFTSLLEGDGVAYCSFEDFGLNITSGAVTNMLYVHQGTGTALGCTRNTYSNIHVAQNGGTWVNAFAMGTDATRAVDSQNFYNCYVSGGFNTGSGNTTTYQYGWQFGNGGAGNVLANFMYGCAAYNVRYPRYDGGSAGGWFGGQVSGCEIAFSALVPNRSLTYDGVRIEVAERIWQCGTGSGSGAVAQVSLRDINYDATYLASDTYCIDHRIGGTLNIENVVVVGAGAAIDPKVFLTTQATSTLTCVVNGLQMQTAFASAFDGSSIGSHKRLIILSYTELSNTPDGDVVTTLVHRQNSGSTWSNFVETTMPLVVPAADGTRGSLVMGHGTAPASPFNGEMWTTTSLASIRMNGAVKDFMLAPTGTTGNLTLAAGVVTLADAINLVVGTSSGTKIGTATSQKIGFFNATPVVQPSGTPADATDLATAITLVNALKAKLVSLGLIA